MIVPYSMHSTEEWVSYVEETSREEFLKSYSHPFLLGMNDFDEDYNTNPLEFVTMVGQQFPAIANGETAKFYQVYEVKKQKRLYSPMISIGRTGNNDIVLESTNISKFHAYFVHKQEENKYFIVDAKSTNKTWINQTELKPSVQVEINDLDIINFGNAVDFQFLDPSSFYNHFSSGSIKS